MPIERINSEQEVTISGERFQQLIRAEHDANQLKAIIADCHENYHSITREDLDLLYSMYIGKKEDSKV